MTYKELIERVKKDCIEYAKKHNDDVDRVNNEFNKGTLTGAATAYENIVHLIEVYENCIESIDEDKLKKIAEESWKNLKKFASAQHVVDGWNNYIYGFIQGYCKAMED